MQITFSNGFSFKKILTVFLLVCLSVCFSRSSIKFEGHMDRKIDDLNPILSKITKLVAGIKSLRFALFSQESLFSSMPKLQDSTGNRADSRYAPSQWKTALLCNNVSHWLGTSLESALPKLSPRCWGSWWAGTGAWCCPTNSIYVLATERIPYTWTKCLLSHR